MQQFLIPDFRDGDLGANRHNQLARHATVHLRERTGQLLGARAARALDGSGVPRTTNGRDPHRLLDCCHGRFLSSELRGDGKRKRIVDDRCRTPRGRRRTLPGWNVVSADGGHLPSLRNFFGRSDTHGYRSEHISPHVWGDCDVQLGLASDTAQLTPDAEHGPRSSAIAQPMEGVLAAFAQFDDDVRSDRTARRDEGSAPAGRIRLIMEAEVGGPEHRQLEPNFRLAQATGQTCQPSVIPTKSSHGRFPAGTCDRLASHRMLHRIQADS